MANRLDAQRFLEDLTGTHARVYTKAISDMVVAVAMKNLPQLVDVRKRFGDIVTETMGASEILGATLTLQRAASELDAFNRQRDLTNFANATTQTVLPRITFDEAVEDMVARTPTTLRRAAERTAQNIARLYGEASGGVPRVAFVRSAEQAVTSRVQSLIAEAIAEGIPEATVGRLIHLGVNEVRKRTAAWSEGYARMVFRTNFNTAVTAGRFRQAQDPDIKQVVPAFEFDAVGDSDTRPNHLAADGIVMLVDNPAWNTIAPPLDYNCRCRVINVSVPMLQRMGRINPDGSIRQDKVPSDAFPAPGFRRGARPDLAMVLA